MKTLTALLLAVCLLLSASVVHHHGLVLSLSAERDALRVKLAEAAGGRAAIAATPARGLNSGYAPSGNFVVTPGATPGSLQVRELAPGVSHMQSIGGSR